MNSTDRPMPRPRPATADVVPFPCRARVGKIRRAAELIHTSLTEKAADARWEQVAGGIARQMERAGIADDVVQAELRIFAQAVCAEVTRLSRGSMQYQPDGGDAA